MLAPNFPGDCTQSGDMIPLTPPRRAWGSARKNL